MIGRSSASRGGGFARSLGRCRESRTARLSAPAADRCLSLPGGAQLSWAFACAARWGGQLYYAAATFALSGRAPAGLAGVPATARADRRARQDRLGRGVLPAGRHPQPGQSRHLDPFARETPRDGVTSKCRGHSSLPDHIGTSPRGHARHRFPGNPCRQNRGNRRSTWETCGDIQAPAICCLLRGDHFPPPFGQPCGVLRTDLIRRAVMSKKGNATSSATVFENAARAGAPR